MKVGKRVLMMVFAVVCVSQGAVSTAHAFSPNILIAYKIAKYCAQVQSDYQQCCANPPPGEDSEMWCNWHCWGEYRDAIIACDGFFNSN